MDIQNVKGTHDILQDEASYYQAIENLFISVAETFGYKEFRTPIIESTQLFKRDQNDSSDMVRKQMYTFNDNAGRSISLRPEGTASVARAIVSNKLYAENDFPIKAYYYGPVFRYERPKAGTYRQFLQFGIENIGLDNAYADAETIILSYRSLIMLGFKNLTLTVNTLGDEESRKNYREALVKFFTPFIDKMCPDCKERLRLNPLRILDCKVPEDQEIIKNAPKIQDYLNEASIKRFNDTLRILKSAGIPYVVDNGIVRGLDYYSHIVYEFLYTSTSGVNVGALGGGGHYDNLISEVGGPHLAGVGFAFGLERIYSVLKADNLLPEISNSLDFYVLPIGENAIEQSFIVCDYLRLLGFKCDAIIEKKSLKAMFHKAEKHNAKFAIIIGDDEVKNREVVIKNLKTQEQVKVKNSDLADYCDNLFLENEEHENCSCHCHDDGCDCCDDECHCHDDECDCEHDGEEHHCCCGGHHGKK